MKIIVVIPARYSSSRFPGKPLAIINGKPMIQHVYERVCRSKRIDNLYVATDHNRIYDVVRSFGGNVIMTSAKHTCGTDRLAECSDILKLDEDDILINVQGDEPLIKINMIEDLIEAFSSDDVYMCTLKKKITLIEEMNNPNVVKVITDKNSNAIYFSRFCIPYSRDSSVVEYYKHIGIYGYKKWFLKKFSNMSKTILEKVESLEQLRVIENGFKIKVLETKYESIGVDTLEQLEIVRKISLKEKNHE